MRLVPTRPGWTAPGSPWRKAGRALRILLLVLLALLVLAPGVRAQQPPDGAPPPPSGADGPLPAMPGDVPDEATRTSSSAQGSGSGALAFFLVVVLGLFGYHLLSNHALNARIDRLEELVRRGGLGGSRKDLVPFHWDTVLRCLEGGLPFLPGASLPRPGLVLLGAPSEALARDLLANLARTVLQDPELVVLAATRRMGPDELGRRLLSLEAGRDWRTLGAQEREALVRGSARDLERYERSLYCMTDLALTPQALFAACQDLLVEGEVGAVLLDGEDVLAPEGDRLDRLDRLRLLAARCHLAVYLVVTLDSQAWKAREREGLFTAVAELSPPAGGKARLAFQRFPGPAPELTLRVDPVSGLLAPGEA